MSMLLDRLRHRAGATARRSSAGSVVPGGPVTTGAGGSSARKRMTMSRRLRRLRQMREALLIDLGALVYEMHRQDRRELHLLERKTEELAAVDEEARALAAALDADGTLAELEMAGIAGSCGFCGAIVSVDSSFCSSCGAPAVSALGGEDAGHGAAPAREDPPGAAAPESETFTPDARAGRRDPPWGGAPDLRTPPGGDRSDARRSGPEPAPRPGRTSVEPQPSAPGAERPSARTVREGFVRRLAGRRPRS